MLNYNGKVNCDTTAGLCEKSARLAVGNSLTTNCTPCIKTLSWANNLLYIGSFLINTGGGGKLPLLADLCLKMNSGFYLFI
jgi:hypothetical protein